MNVCIELLVFGLACSMYINHDVTMAYCALVLDVVCRDFFKLGEGIEPHQLLTRSHGGRKRAIYMTSSTISKLIPKNEDFVKVHVLCNSTVICFCSLY